MSTSSSTPGVGLPGEDVEPLVERERLALCARPRGRGPGPGGRRAAAARRTRSCPRRARARPRSSRGCCRAPRGRALVPDPLHDWHPGHQKVVRLSSPWPRARTRVAAARARAAGALVDLRLAASGGRRGPRPASAAARRARSRSTSSSLTCPAGRHGSTPAMKQASLFQRLPIPARMRWSSRASPIPRVGSSSRSRRRNGRLVEVLGHDVGPQSGQPQVEAGARVGHQLQHGAVELDHLVLGGANHQPGPAGGAGPALAGAVHAPAAAHPQVRVEGQVALEAHEEVLAAGVAPADGAPGQALGPAVHAVSGVRGLDRRGSRCPPARRRPAWRRGEGCRPRASSGL